MSGAAPEHAVPQWSRPATGSEYPALAHAVEVMDRLRSPGGCPWDAAQTAQSLTTYLLEETYEVLDAIETGDPVSLREELGDLLLQVLFHARLAEELPAEEAFGIDDVAADLVAKLVHRHPHVFADETVDSVEELNETWERRKVAEKGRTSLTDGVPSALPALALTAKLTSRARRAGLSNVEPNDETEDAPGGGSAEDAVGLRLFAMVREAHDLGVDPEASLRRVTARYRKRLIGAERAMARGQESPDR